nr:unnamed protein product [Spirometra erinaceieuropaei]
MCLLDSPRGTWSERMTASIAREFTRLEVDIGQLEEASDDYTIFWNDCPKGERIDAGVDFAIRTTSPSAAGHQQPAHDPAVASSGAKFATTISAEAPAMNEPYEMGNKFYEELHAVLASVPKADKLVVLVTSVSAYRQTVLLGRGVPDPHGTGDCENNLPLPLLLLLLLQSCAEHSPLRSDVVM